VSSSSFAVTRFEEPSVAAAVGATASAPELHCLMNRPVSPCQSPPRTLAFAPLRGWEHSALAASFVAAFRSTSKLRAGAR
jgi:hypothetical protein